MVTIDARAGKWLALALLISFGLNLFFGGLLAGRALMPRHGMPTFDRFVDRPGGGIFHRMGAMLSPEDRAKFEAALGERRRDAASNFTQIREARGKIREALKAEPFDPKALETAFTEIRNRHMAMQKSMHDAAIHALGQISPEGRKRLSEFHPERPPR